MLSAILTSVSTIVTSLFSNLVGDVSLWTVVVPEAVVGAIGRSVGTGVVKGGGFVVVAESGAVFDMILGKHELGIQV